MRVPIVLSLLWAATVLPAAPKFVFERLALHQFEDGPLLPDSYEFLPGETGWFSCRMAGFSVEPEEETRHVSLIWELRVVDAAGVLLEAPQNGEIDQKLRSQDKDWAPKFLANFQVPPFAPGGVYRVAIVAKDEIAHAEIKGELAFRVRAAAFVPADTLTIRNFHFFRGENDTAPMTTSAYRQGSTLWARFEIVGYKFQEDNRFSVDYGLTVLAPDGKELFTQPEAATESKESFYPQRLVPGGLSLNLEKNLAVGTYTLVVVVHDKISGQATEQRATFRVE